MRNKALPSLLRQTASGQLPRALQWPIIFIEAATELEKLDTIESVLKKPTSTKDDVVKIINDKE
jgi:hypothetical protein